MTLYPRTEVIKASPNERVSIDDIPELGAFIRLAKLDQPVDELKVAVSEDFTADVRWTLSGATADERQRMARMPVAGVVVPTKHGVRQ
jgi:hypothetical protein